MSYLNHNTKNGVNSSFYYYNQSPDNNYQEMNWY